MSDSNPSNSSVLSLLRNCKCRVSELMNNVVIAILGLVEDLSREDFREQFEVNILVYKSWQMLLCALLKFKVE